MPGRLKLHEILLSRMEGERYLSDDRRQRLESIGIDLTTKMKGGPQGPRKPKTEDKEKKTDDEDITAEGGFEKLIADLGTDC